MTPVVFLQIAAGLNTGFPRWINGPKRAQQTQSLGPSLLWGRKLARNRKRDRDRERDRRRYEQPQYHQQAQNEHMQTL